MRSAAVPPPATESPAAGVEFSLTSRRHDAIGPRGRWWVFASLCALSFGFALMFAALGAWLVLPYSALEMGVLFWAFHRFERGIADWERITVCGDRVVVESEQAGVRAECVFNCHWLRIELEEQGFGRAPALALRYAGKRTVFGDALPAGERIKLSRDLRRVLAAAGKPGTRDAGDD
ncbi:MAG TPA: DUF2244 domain-containing protein [Casimicrobiaceae bacterium]|jgi:uncharacterized membrane protein